MSFVKSQKTAFIAPFAVFMLMLCMADLCGTAAKYWVYPVQTLACGGFVIGYWRYYGLKAPAKIGFTLLIAVIVLLAWISPQTLFHAPPRSSGGFDPSLLENRPLVYFASLTMRFLRLAVVVPFIEEIFWRGFLLRYLIREDFETVPFGAFSWLSFAIVTIGFCFEHQPADRPAALLTGALFNLVAYRTRSLSSCVLVHAATNLLLGIYIMHTGQWGFW